MSHVNCMEIRGIRSYSPHKSVYMTFSKPVTLILGHNGSGKTTIIECLKYACTGSTPSSSKTNFVHNPKLTDNESEIRGQVKLEFKDIFNSPILVSRMMCTTQKLKTQSTKTLDQTIKRYDAETKKPVSLTMRCADLDKEMIRLLGVSASVLNNVIFCHQEDSLWPLSEGSNVKKKFDEIFGQKRQVKCVDELRKKFKDIKQTNLLNQKELEHLRNNQDKASEIKEELDKVEYSLDLGKQEVGTIDGEIEELQGKLEESHKKVKEVHSLEKKRDECNTTLEFYKKNKTKLVDGLTSDPEPYPTEKLRKMLSTFEGDLQDKKKKEHEMTLRLTDIIESHDKAEQNMHQFNMDLGRLREAQKAYAKLEQENETCVRNLTDLFGDSSVLLLDEGVKVPDSVNVIQWVEGQVDMARIKEEKKEETKKVEQDGVYRRTEELKKSLNQSEGELKIKRESKKKVKEEMDKLLVEIRDIKTSASTLSRLELDKTAAEEELEQFKQSSRLEEITQKIVAKSQEIKKISEKQAQLSSELEVLNLEAEARQDRERAEHVLSTKEGEIEKILSTHETTIKFHLDSMPPPGCHSKTLSKYLTVKNAEIKSQGVRLSAQQKSLTQKELELKIAKTTLTDLETKTRKIRDKIVEVCANPALYESECERAEKEYNAAKKEHASVTGVTHVFSKFSSKISSTHACPICKTHLGENKAKAVSENLQKQIQRAPEELEKAKSDEALKEARLFALKSAAVLYTELNELEREKIPELSVKVSTLEGQITEERENVEDMEDASQTLAANEYEARAMEKDLDYVDRLQKECDGIKDKIRDLSSRLVSTYDKTLKEAIEEQAHCQEIYSGLQHEHSRLSDSKTRGEAKRNALQQRVFGLQEQHVALSTKMQGLKAMEERRKEKAVEITQLSESERKIEDVVKPTGEELEKLEVRLSTLKEEEKTRQKNVQDVFNKLNNAVESARRIEQQLANSSSSGSSNLSSLSENLEQCKEEYGNLKFQKKKLDGQLTALKRELANSKVKQRELEDCLEIRGIEQRIDSTKEEIAGIERQLKQQGFSEARSEANKLQDSITEKSQAKAGQEGRNRGFTDQLNRLKRELNSSMFKEAQTTCHHQVIKCAVGLQAARDLDMYILAFERAIMRFHSDKMTEINKTLREMWTQIYRGGDIDYIEIKTDDDAAESAGRRKTCNYRVVMFKGGVQIDMRQHSSAGQRVLAALLIRLALAETFCENCGIITLDEPTTNLDRDNIQSLATALGNFIKSRRNAGHFQLIIITHDEDFVELLGRSGEIEHFFKVGKDHDMFSTIQKKNMVGV